MGISQSSYVYAELYQQGLPTPEINVPLGADMMDKTHLFSFGCTLPSEIEVFPLATNHCLMPRLCLLWCTLDIKNHLFSENSQCCSGTAAHGGLGVTIPGGVP